MKTKDLTLFLIIGFLLCFSYVEARQNLSSDVLAGGGTNPWALDRFVTGGDGQDDSCSAPSCSYAVLADGDGAIVFDYTNGKMYYYVYDIDSAQAEDSPKYIAPDYTECVGACTGYVGDGRWVLISLVADGLETIASIEPSVVFDDSDSAGEITDAKIYADATDEGAGTEDVDLFFQVQVNSVLTTILQLDADGNVECALDMDLATGKVYKINGSQIDHEDLASTGDMATVGRITGRTMWGTDVTGNTNHDTIECHNVIYYVTVASVITLDAAADAGFGAVVTYYTRDAEAVSIDCDGAEVINLNGTAGGNGKMITNTSTAGDFITLIATTDADGAGKDGWITLGRSGAWTMEV